MYRKALSVGLVALFAVQLSASETISVPTPRGHRNFVIHPAFRQRQQPRHDGFSTGRADLEYGSRKDAAQPLSRTNLNRIAGRSAHAALAMLDLQDRAFDKFDRYA